MAKQYPVNEVHWNDAITSYGWTGDDGTDDPLIKSIGWLVHEDDKVVVLSTSISSHDSVVDKIQILKSSIVARWEVVLK